MKTTLTTAFLPLALALALTQAATAQTFTSHPVNIPGSSNVIVHGINDTNEMVLNYTDTAGTFHCLLLSGKTVTHIVDPNEIGTGSGKGTTCWGINNSGQVVGSYSTAMFGNGFVYNAGVYTDIIIPTATAGTTSYGINNVGQVVGSYAANDGQHGFVYTISSGVWQQLDVPGATATLAVGINDAGTITFEWVNPTFVFSASILYKGKYFSLNVPGAQQSKARTINVHGSIVMEAQDAAGNWHGYLYKGGTFKQFDVAASAGTHPYGLNDQGVIVGGFNPSATSQDEVGFYGHF